MKTITTIIIAADGTKTTLIATNVNEVKTSVRTLGAMWIGHVAVQDIRQTVTIDFRENPEGVMTKGIEVYSKPYIVSPLKYLEMKEEIFNTTGGGYVFTSAKFEGGGETRTVPLENISGIVNIDDLIDIITGKAPSGKAKMLENMSKSGDLTMKSIAKLTEVMEKVFEGSEHIIDISLGAVELNHNHSNSSAKVDTLLCPAGCKIPMEEGYEEELPGHAGTVTGFDTIPDKTK